MWSNSMTAAKPTGFGFGTTTTTGGGFGAGTFAAAGTAPSTTFSVTGATAGSTTSASGWGAPAPAQAQTGSTGFGTWGGTSAGGFGQPQPAVPPQAMLASLDVSKQSATGRYLLEMDGAYNALSPKCKFRTFVYNICIPGQGEKAMERERYTAAQAGGGCAEEEWVRAREQNPDPENMYPAPLHFMQELRSRSKKQEEAIALFQGLVDTIATRTQRLKELQDKNEAAQRALQLDRLMLQRRWLSLLRKTEMVRQAGQPLGIEQQEIGGPVAALTAMLNAPGHFNSAVSNIQPFVDAEVAWLMSSSSRPGFGDLESAGEPRAGDCLTSRTAATGSVGGGVPSGLLTRRLDALALKQWVQFIDRMQEGIEALDVVLHNDVADVARIRSHMEHNA